LDAGRRRVGLRADNVISITDGQIFRKTNLFNAGVSRQCGYLGVARGISCADEIRKSLSGGIRRPRPVP
jgi:F0F1-type ATP synthase alpha subunit